MLIITCLVNGCGHKASTQTQLSELTNAFSTAGSQPQQGEAAVFVNVAADAVRHNDYAGGIVALQSARHLPNMTPEQLRAVQNAMQTLTADLVQRAAKGDTKAQADLAAIEKTRSQ